MNTTDYKAAAERTDAEERALIPTISSQRPRETDEGYRRRIADTNKAQHSPLPWNCHHCGNGGETWTIEPGIASVTSEADAKMIVASVNHADKLAEALRDIAADAQEANEKRNAGEWDFRCTHIEARAKQALAAYEAAQ